MRVLTRIQWRVLTLTLLALVVACNGGGGTLPPPTPWSGLEDCPATGDSTKLTPEVTCVAADGSSRIVVFGFKNEGDGAVSLPHGAANRLAPAPDPRFSPITARPPTIFEPGRVRSAFAVQVLGDVTWELAGKTASSATAAATCEKKIDGREVYLEVPGIGGTSPTRFVLERDPGRVMTETIVDTDTPFQGQTVGAVPGAFAVTDDGAATYTLPIEVPGGRAGVQPDLSVVYHHRGSNGLLGVGWTLSGLSQISRCHKNHSVDAYYDTVAFNPQDRFCLDGDYLKIANQTPDTPSSGEMRPEHDPYTRVRVEEYDDLGPKSFTVELKNGRIIRYGGVGATLEGDRYVDAEGTATYSPQGIGRARLAWFVSEVRDRSWNVMRYHYEEVGAKNLAGCEAAAGPCVSYELRPKQITYTHRGVTGAATKAVSFDYEDRPDVEVAMISGFPLRRGSRLKAIKTFAPSPVTQALVRTYNLTYRTGSLSERSLLATVSECDAKEICKRPTTFNYEAGDAGFERVEDLLGVAFPGTSKRSNIVVADYNGDGRDDLLYFASGGAWRLRLSNGAAGFDPPTDPGLPSYRPSGTGGSDPLPVAVDIDMDGVVDLAYPTRKEFPIETTSGTVMRFGAQYRYYTLKSGKFVPHATLFGTEPEAVANNENPLAFADLTGDALPEILEPSGSGFTIHFHPWTKATDGAAPYEKRFFTSGSNEVQPFLPNLAGTTVAVTGMKGANYTTRRVTKIAAAYFPPPPTTIVDGATPLPTEGFAYTFFDVNGDGLADVFEQKTGIKGGALGLTLNFGAGFKRVSIPTTDENLQWGPQGIRGVIALDYFQNGRPAIFLAGASSSIGGYTSKKRLFTFKVSGAGYVLEPRDTPPATGGVLPYLNPMAGGSTILGEYLRQVQSLDVDGDGLEDLILAEESGSAAKMVLYRRKGKRADLLTGIQDGQGDTTAVRYNPLQFTAGGCAFPVRCGARGLWIVAGFDAHVQDSTAKRSQVFAYDKPASDVQSGAFLGFGYRWSRDVQNGTETTTLYERFTEKVGRVYPFVRMPTSIATKSDVGTGILREQRTIVYEAGTTPEVASFAWLARPKSVTDNATDTNSTGTVSTSSFARTYDYDDYGNVKKASMRAGLAGVTDTTETTFTNDVGRWLLGQPITQTTTSRVDAAAAVAPQPAQLIRKRAFATEPTTGQITSVTIEPEGNASLKLTQLLLRGVYGQVVSIAEVDASGRRRQVDIVYDSIDGSYPQRVTDPNGFVTESTYHHAHGALAEEVAPNGVIVSRSYDGFGRARRVAAPRCTSGACPASTATTTLRYLGADRAGVVFGVQVDRAGAPGHYTGYDSLGRVAREVEIPRFCGHSV